MVLEKEPELIVDTKLLKAIGLYQILDSRSPKLFGYNIFKYGTVLESFLVGVALVGFSMSAYFCLGDINESVRYISLAVVATSTFYKQRCVIVYSDSIWSCIFLTSVESLSFNYYSRYILENGKKKLKMFLTYFVVLWSTFFVFWISTPFVVNDSYVIVERGNKVSRYRLNIVNVLFPVSDKFYNENFKIFYIIEFVIVSAWAHSSLIYDVLLTIMCIATSYQFKLIANGFSTLGNTENHSTTGDRMPIVRHDELKVMNDFKTLIQDQQKVVDNMKNIFEIIQRIILFQIASTSILLISLSTLPVLNYFNGYSLFCLTNIKTVMSMLLEASHIFFICYLSGYLNDQKDSLNFSLYSGDWTGKSVQYKKMILLTMQMNSGNYLKLHVTMKRIVNLEMFASVMQTTFSVISVWSKQCEKIQ